MVEASTFPDNVKQSYRCYNEIALKYLVMEYNFKKAFRPRKDSNLHR